ncbi:MAG: HAD-IA family hydrolase [Hyphomonas sp.]|jgi:FMN phosphatase YigB (HAD superfamily)|uniref:HAD family hydrolase n=1 Tax=Hyphomonas sp. TaxID=87 RepID=UPI0037C13A76|nr:HAD-IA family hydrolase [Hyphomonas sp.]
MAARIALFDLGGVILDWSPARLYSQIFSDSAECERFLASVCTMDWHTQHDAGVSFADNAAALALKFPQYESQIRAWGGRWMEMFDGCIAGSERLVENLTGSGRALYALSNMPAEVWPEMREAFPVLSRFRHVVVSGEIRLIKPDPKIFHYTLARMGGPSPDEVLFIDDSAKNIATADALGFRTHLFRGASGLERALILEGLL